MVWLGGPKPIYTITDAQFGFRRRRNIRLANYYFKIFNWGKGCTVQLCTILKYSIQLIDWICGINSLSLEYKENRRQSWIIITCVTVDILYIFCSEIRLVICNGMSFLPLYVNECEMVFINHNCVPIIKEWSLF